MAFLVLSLAPANGGAAFVCPLNARRLARPRFGPRPFRSRRVSSQLTTRPSSVDVVRVLAPMPSAHASYLTVAAFVVAFLAPAHGGAVLARVLSMHGAPRAIASALARLSRFRRVSSRLPARPSSVDIARELAPLPSARASCLTVAAFLVVSFAPANGGAAFACVLSMHGASRDLAPALGRLARAASRRGSPLVHLRLASRARWFRTITSMSCLTVAAFVGVSLAPANGGAAFVCDL